MNKDARIARQFGMSASELSDWKLSMRMRALKIKEDLATTDVGSIFTKYSIGPIDLALLIACEMLTAEEVETYGLRSYLQEETQAYA